MHLIILHLYAKMKNGTLRQCPSFLIAQRDVTLNHGKCRKWRGATDMTCLELNQPPIFSSDACGSGCAHCTYMAVGQIGF